ncbi:alpha/beta fold hydrolase [Actinomadura sp. J1-007]|uniref:alpha/beta fold hydrolase n=1 Tax=Actinomadura sp. J1-007 TaxID=2661913 RepID=UPI001324A76C|nr:alpha/beta hydrolase [Actinomadura sp. J1-007]MWK38314.1 alpha/beta fold hydrolase [Actinomadura sp. J1-007]
MNRATAMRVVGLAVGGVASTGVAAVPPAAAAAADHPTVDWWPCPSYSDAAIRTQGISDKQIPQFRAQMKRLECGRVSVPLDYRRPNGRKISIAITRLGAVDNKRRLGSIAYLTGGPGKAGFLAPLTYVTLKNKESARLNDRYDLIGIDPRGVNYSTQSTSTRCGIPGADPNNPGPGTEKPGLPTKASAKKSYDAQVSSNRSCGRSDPAFLGQLTSMNVVRDLDRVRAALGEPKLNLYGASQGVWFGLMYRSMFPGRAGRAFLDSVPPPWTRHRVDKSGNVTADAAERNFARMAAWLARRHATYGLGTTAAQVRAAVLKLRRDYDRHPKKFADMKNSVDGVTIALLAGKTSPDWSRAGQALAELRHATGPTAPPTVKEMFGAEPAKPVPGAPEILNITMHRATKCNEDFSRLSFSRAWADYWKRLKRDPVTGRAFGPAVPCAGWPLPAQELRFQRGEAPLVLSGHRYEQATAYEWTRQTQRAVGGEIYTVDDDVHTSALSVPECAADIVTYFNTGRIDRGCKGVRPPA